MSANLEQRHYDSTTRMLTSPTDWTAGIPACTSPLRPMSASVLSNQNRFTPTEATAWQAEMPALQSHPPSLQSYPSTGRS